MSATHSGWHRALTWATALLVLRPAFAQNPADLNELRSSATLPVSNESILLSSRAVDAIESGDYRLAIQLIEQIYGQQDGLIPLPASATFYPAWRQAERLLHQLPPAGTRMAQQLSDAGVAAAFEDARRSGNVEALRELFWRRPLSAHRGDIALELAAWYLDRGQFAGATEVLREMTPSDPTTRASVEAMRAVALAESGAPDEARRAGERLLADVNDADRQRFQPLVTWLAGRSAAGGPAVASEFEPVLAAPANWSTTLAGPNAPAVEQDSSELLDALDALHRLPVLEPAIGEGVLLVRLRGTLWAFDTLTLSVLWRTGEIGAGAIDPQLLVQSAAEMGMGGRRWSPQTRMMLTHRLAHAATIGRGAVYTVEQVGAGVSDAFGGARGRTVAFGGAHGVLVARELRSGRILWRSDDEPAQPLAQVSFQDRPLLLDDRLLAPFERQGELILAALHPDSGRLLQEVRVASPPTHFGAGGRCVLQADETTVYLCTGNGAVAAFERPSLNWKWATLYQSTVAERNSRFWWQPAADPLEWAPEAPLLAGDLLIVAPVDSAASEVIAFDRYDGAKRWSLPRRDITFLVGTVADGLIVGSHRLICLDLHQPSAAPRWRSVPLEIVGRPQVDGQRVYVPTRRGIVVVDGRTGKLLREQNSAAILDAPATSLGGHVPAESEACSLAMGDAAIYRVTPTRVAKYPDVNALRRQVAALRARDPADGRLELLGARIAALAGNLDDAIRELELHAGDAAAPNAEQTQLLGELYLAMARSANATEQRLKYLRKALVLGERGGDPQTVALLLGDELASGGRPQEALDVFRTVLLDRGTAGQFEHRSSSYRVAFWLAAVTRMRECVLRLGAAQARPAIGDLVREAQGGPDAAQALFRLRMAVPDGGLRALVNRALAEQRLPPELAIGVFDELRLQPKLEAESSALRLGRWETHLSLGLLEEAARDQAEWEASQRGADSTDPEVVRRVQLLENSQRKLRDLAGVRLGVPFYRQWKMPGAELLFDPREPLAATRQWLAIRNLDSRALQLIDSVSNQQPWRDHVDALTSDFSGDEADASARRDALAGRRPGEGEISRPYWPVAIHQFLAAVPVEKGLICIGLGPERYAGQRLWELTVPDWNEIPRRFASLAVATAEGVLLCPRSDRIALAEWSDGRIAWERDWPGAEIRGLDASGDALAVWTDNGSVWQCRLSDGDGLRRIELDSANVSGLHYSGSTLIIWGGDFVCGVSRSDGRVLWRRVVPGVGGITPVTGRDWLLLRPLGQLDWDLLDSNDGESVFGSSLGDLGNVRQAAANGEQLLLASNVDEEPETGETRAIGLYAISLADARRRWEQRILTRVDVNLTQLLGMDDYIPLLRAERAPDAPTGQEPTLVLVSKADGSVQNEVSLADEYRAHSSASCDLQVLATPSRILVQIAGNLLAFGNSEGPPAADGR